MEKSITAIEQAQENRDQQAFPNLDPRQFETAQRNIDQAKTAVAEAITRIDRLEHWVESASSAGNNDLPPLVPPTTSHPQPDTPASGELFAKFFELSAQLLAYNPIGPLN